MAQRCVLTCRNCFRASVRSRFGLSLVSLGADRVVLALSWGSFLVCLWADFRLNLLKSVRSGASAGRMRATNSRVSFSCINEDSSTENEKIFPWKTKILRPKMKPFFDWKMRILCGSAEEEKGGGEKGRIGRRSKEGNWEEEMKKRRNEETKKWRNEETKKRRNEETKKWRNEEIQSSNDSPVVLHFHFASLILHSVILPHFLISSSVSFHFSWVFELDFTWAWSSSFNWMKAQLKELNWSGMKSYWNDNDIRLWFLYEKRGIVHLTWLHFLTDEDFPSAPPRRSSASKSCCGWKKWIQTSSFLIQNSSFLTHNSSFLIQIHHL